MRTRTLGDLLQPTFDRKRTAAAVDHFQRMTQYFQMGQWERAISYGGKLVEAVLKALWVHAGKTLPPARKFKASQVIQDLRQLPHGTFDDTVRLTVPRACEFLYDIASNRGARHDPDEIDPNEMDASGTVALCAWILGEMIRYSQKGAVNDRDVISAVAGLTQRRYPLIEEIDGRVYFYLPNLSARDVALLTLWYHHPSRLASDELVTAVSRHGFTPRNARVAVARIKRVVDTDRHGGLRLLQPGLADAEAMLASPKARVVQRR